MTLTLKDLVVERVQISACVVVVAGEPCDMLPAIQQLGKLPAGIVERVRFQPAPFAPCGCVICSMARNVAIASRTPRA